MLEIKEAIRKDKYSNGQTYYIFECKNAKCPNLIKKTRYYAKTSSGYCKRCFSGFKHKKPIDNRKQKICRECNNKQDIEYYQLRSSGHRRSVCKGCINLKRVFGINLNDYNEILKKQNNVCGICKNKEVEKHQSGKTRKLAVDHCHKSGKIRGLLCTSCNQGLGKFKDSIPILTESIKYLENYNGN